MNEQKPTVRRPLTDVSAPLPAGGSRALLSTAYFGPVQWYQKLNRYDTCLIERCDNFVK